MPFQAALVSICPVRTILVLRIIPQVPAQDRGPHAMRPQIVWSPLMKYAMSEFYLSDANDLVRCQGSLAEQTRVMVFGRVGNEIKIFKGIVLAINEDHILKGWRISMRDQ